MLEWLWRRPSPEVRLPAAEHGGRISVDHASTGRPHAPHTTPLPCLASATRDYARAVEAGRIGRLDERDLVRLYAAMGSEIWAWQYARRLAGLGTWRAGPDVDEACERVRAAQQMTDDIDTWVRAETELVAERGRALLYGKPPPPPLEVPPAVRALIDARRQAALERATRRRARAEGGSGPPVIPGDAIPHPTPPVGLV